MTPADRATPPPSLSAAMREGSRAEHRAAEGSSFMAELLDGRVNETGYADYLRRLRLVYATLEQCVRARVDHPADAAVAAVADPALERLDALDADLEHWAPGVSHDTDSPAATAYCDRLRAAADPARPGGLLVAHHYTRYLGDLSGGQAIGRILDRSFGLGGAGTAFYAFPAIPAPRTYKDAYRARLDALDLTEAEQTSVVAEVRTAFALNQALFAELGTRLADYRRSA